MPPTGTASRRRAAALMIAAGATAAACHLEEPFRRDNHWDPEGSATKILIAPESTFSIGERFTVTLTGDPPLPPGLLNISWVSNGDDNPETQVFAAGYGEFVVSKAHAGYLPVSVTARFDDAIVAATVMVGQKLSTFDLYCGSAAAPQSCDATTLAVNATRTVSSTMRDANTNTIVHREFLMQRATTVSRDPGVLSSAPTTANANGTWTVRGVAPGATWLVVTADGVRDSVRVVVGP